MYSTYTLYMYGCTCIYRCTVYICLFAYIYIYMYVCKYIHVYTGAYTLCVWVHVSISCTMREDWPVAGEGVLSRSSSSLSSSSLSLSSPNSDTLCSTLNCSDFTWRMFPPVSPSSCPSSSSRILSRGVDTDFPMGGGGRRGGIFASSWFPVGWDVTDGGGDFTCFLVGEVERVGAKESEVQLYLKKGVVGRVKNGWNMTACVWVHEWLCLSVPKYTCIYYTYSIYMYV